VTVRHELPANLAKGARCPLSRKASNDSTRTKN
jgi:hypothetical protein